VERARDHHKKRDFLTRLRRKAALRNPDEFYHGMVHTQTKAGVHELDRDDAIDTDTVQLLKTQDVAYLSTAKRKEEEKIRRLREGLHDISAPDKVISFASLRSQYTSPGFLLMVWTAPRNHRRRAQRSTRSSWTRRKI